MKVERMPYGYNNVVSKKELKEDSKIFEEAQKKVNKAEVRNADWGLYAAQNCLAKDLVNANPDEVGLIMDKMNFIQAKMNANMELDSRLFSEQVDAKNGRSQARAEALRTGGDTVVNIAGTTGKLVGDVSGIGRTLKLVG